ncbi:MAG: hypothetical protein GYA24_07350 [Candidatus Lokiarchaeota archaeon]|nr:hypothetical protein [Candidatus Lokiarchaeota archaeon]
MVKVVCPNCAADLDVAADAPIHTCDYCGTAIQVNVMFGDKGAGDAAAGGDPKENYIIKDHYIIRCHYNQDMVKSLLVDWVKKIPGAPQDFEDAANINEIKLKFYPIWVGEYAATSDYVGLDDWPNFSRPAPDRPGWYEMVTYSPRQESGRVIREYQIPLMALPEQRLPAYLRDYAVTTTGKEYFDIKHVKKLSGEIIDSALKMNDARANMRQQVLDRQAREMHKEVKQIQSRSDDVQEKGVYYIHFPVYQINFIYNGKPHDALVDGSSGRIVYVKAPISKEFRAKTMGAGGAFLGGGLVLFLVGLLSAIGIIVPAIIPVAGISIGACLIIVGFLFFGLNMRKQASEKQR